MLLQDVPQTISPKANNKGPCTFRKKCKIFPIPIRTYSSGRYKLKVCHVHALSNSSGLGRERSTFEFYASEAEAQGRDGEANAMRSHGVLNLRCEEMARSCFSAGSDDTFHAFMMDLKTEKVAIPTNAKSLIRDRAIRMWVQKPVSVIF